MLQEKIQEDTLEGKIYKHIDALLTPENIGKIKQNYPDKALKRRNNGYALDALSDMLIGHTIVMFVFTEVDMTVLMNGSLGVGFDFIPL